MPNQLQRNPRRLLYVTDYESVHAGFRNPELLSRRRDQSAGSGDPMGKYIPVQLDGPLHPRWRAMLDPLFSLTRMESYRHAIRDEAVRLLEEVAEDDLLHVRGHRDLDSCRIS